MYTPNNHLIMPSRTCGLLAFSLTQTLFCACGSSSDLSLNHYSDEVTASASTLEESATSHYEAMIDAHDVNAMHDLEETHTDDDLGIFGHMQDAQDSLEMCRGHMHTTEASSLSDPLMTMHSDMDEILNEIEHHEETIADLDDMDSCITEEKRHRQAMLDALDQLASNEDDLHSAMDSIEHSGMSMMCPMSSHVHRDE